MRVHDLHAKPVNMYPRFPRAISSNHRLMEFTSCIFCRVKHCQQRMVPFLLSTTGLSCIWEPPLHWHTSLTRNLRRRLVGGTVVTSLATWSCPCPALTALIHGVRALLCSCSHSATSAIYEWDVSLLFETDELVMDSCAAACASTHPSEHTSCYLNQ